MTPFERLFAFMTQPWVIGFYCIFLSVVFFYFDQPIAYYFHAMDLGIIGSLLQGMTKIGSGGIYIGGLFLLALLLRKIRPNSWQENATWFMWVGVLLSSALCYGLKIALGRARPELLFQAHLYGFYGIHQHVSFWSFPSGHTTVIMSLVFSLSTLFPRFGYALIGLGFAIASARIVLTYHYLSDVMAASFLAMLVIGYLLVWLQKKKKLIYSAAIVPGNGSTVDWKEKSE